MSTRSAFARAIAATAALSLAACTPADPPPPADAPAAGVAAPTEAPAGSSDAIDAIAVVDLAPVADAPPSFDVRAFAGTFVSEGARLRLAADGTYAFTVHAESADADLASTGTWTVDADGGLLLDPDSKAAPDQSFTIGSEGELVAADGGHVLRRDGA